MSLISLSSSSLSSDTGASFLSTSALFFKRASVRRSDPRCSARKGGLRCSLPDMIPVSAQYSSGYLEGFSPVSSLLWFAATTGAGEPPPTYPGQISGTTVHRKKCIENCSSRGKKEGGVFLPSRAESPSSSASSSCSMPNAQTRPHLCPTSVITPPSPHLCKVHRGRRSLVADCSLLYW